VHGNVGMNASKATLDILALHGPRNDTVIRTDLLREKVQHHKRPDSVFR
jgi:hypothetical protein